MVGICAMTKKSKSKPMTQILERLCRFHYINVVIFPEEVILEEPVEKWPLCDCLVSFHSKGTTHSFLYAKAPLADLSVRLCDRRVDLSHIARNNPSGHLSRCLLCSPCCLNV